MSLIDIIFRYRKAYRNWFFVLYQMYKTRNLSDKLNYKIKIILKSNGKMNEVPRGLVGYYAFLLLNPKIQVINIEDNKITFSFKGYKLKFINPWEGDIIAPLVHEDYRFLNPKDEVVIDIGANIGGTLLYFCIEGAKKVIALEPYPYTFKLLSENVNLSDCAEKIELLNAGYGNDRLIKVDESFIPNSGSNLKEIKNGKGKLINLYSLKTILLMFNIKEALLKMDCEGCEYNLLNEDRDTIRRFKRIQIEYHYGYEELYNYLKDDFDVKYIEPKNAYNPSASNPNMKVGYIYATRKEN